MVRARWGEGKVGQGGLVVRARWGGGEGKVGWW